ncbi:MAG: helix-turn-helix transcriptional regulator [Bacteroidales bacterium]|nr:helix-turn-helix transcriptional regulator [Bacteroidales bacterium]
MSKQADIKTFSPVVQAALDAIPDDFKAAFDMNFDISERIHAILAAKGMTQKQLANTLNKRESEVSKWLTGRHNFTIATVAKISQALGEDIIRVTA